MPLRDINSCLSILATRDLERDELFGIQGRRKYPIKLLRYLFMAAFLDEAQHKARRPIRVCEIGVDRGQMLDFFRHYANAHDDRLAERVSDWDAVSATIREDVLRKTGYTTWRQAYVEDPDFMGSINYDVVVLCHLVEHLHRPEDVVSTAAKSLLPGGVIIGGMPVTPEFGASFRQNQLRKRAQAFGHVSVFSPQRIRRMAASAGLECEVLTGAYFMRNNGSRLENSRGWASANITFGRMFPWWPGEIYWQMRRA